MATANPSINSKKGSGPDLSPIPEGGFLTTEDFSRERQAILVRRQLAESTTDMSSGRESSLTLREVSPFKSPRSPYPSSDADDEGSFAQHVAPPESSPPSSDADDEGPFVVHYNNARSSFDDSTNVYQENVSVDFKKMKEKFNKRAQGRISAQRLTNRIKGGTAKRVAEIEAFFEQLRVEKQAREKEEESALADTVCLPRPWELADTLPPAGSRNDAPGEELLQLDRLKRKVRMQKQSEAAQLPRKTSRARLASRMQRREALRVHQYAQRRRDHTRPVTAVASKCPIWKL